MESKTKRYCKSSFTPEQKKEYRQKKESEKQQLLELYQNFLAKHTIRDFIGVITNYKTMHKYTMRNFFMCLAQAEKRNDTKFVGVLNSYQNWNKQNIQVLKGSKGYKVLVPIFSKVKSLESESQNTANQDEQNDSKQVLSYFKLGNTFDISQTTEYENYLKEQKEIDKVIMKNAEIDYNTALNFAKANFPKVKITEQFKDQSTKGQYDPLTKEIFIYEKSSHTVFHELGHHIIKSVLNFDVKEYAKDEVLAELTAYLLMIRFDENIDYNFKYSNVWSNRIRDTFEIQEFEHYFKTLTKYLDKFEITKVEGN